MSNSFPRIVRACPFPPGAPKPKTMSAPDRPWLSLMKKKLGTRGILVITGLVSMVFLYTHAYSNMNFTGKPIIFEDNFFLLLSFYSYLSSIAIFFVKKHRTRAEEKEAEF